MSYEIGASVLPPVSAGVLVGIMLWFRRERMDQQDKLEKMLREIIESRSDEIRRHLDQQDKRMNDLVGYYQIAQKLDREISDRLSRLEGAQDEHRHTRKE